MKSKTTERVLSETPQEVKDEVRKYANEVVIMRKQAVEELAKEYRKTTPNQMHGDELGFISGFSRRKEIEQKILRDQYNHYNSKLKELTKPKLDRRDRTETVIKLEAKVELLKELKNKLCG